MGPPSATETMADDPEWLLRRFIRHEGQIIVGFVVRKISGAWLSWLERHIHIVEVIGSNPIAPIVGLY